MREKLRQKSQQFTRSIFLSHSIRLISNAELSKEPQRIRIYKKLVRIKIRITRIAKKVFPENKVRRIKRVLVGIAFTAISFWIISVNSIFLLSEHIVHADYDPVVNERNASFTLVVGNTELNPKEISLKRKYQILAGPYYAENIEPYLPVIDKVLREKGLDYDSKLIQGMFYVGQQESHWTSWRVSRFNIAGGHPTGIFQFLPGTFRTVSSGDIFDPEDQVRAFITMWERYRCDEFATVFICNYGPCLTPELKSYLLNAGR